MPSGERSNPSAPRPAVTFVIRQVFLGIPPGGPDPGGGPPGGGVAPGGGPGLGAGTCSMMLIVQELTLEVKKRSSAADTRTMCVQDCPGPINQSALCDPGAQQP